MHELMESWIGPTALICFILAYLLVIFEEKLHMRKSKPVIFIGCFMWLLIGVYEAYHGGGHAEEHIEHLVVEIGELFFFLLVAMTYINALQERLVFDSLRSWLLRKGLGFRSLFWATGGITFFLSPVADNLTSALLMATVAEAVSGGNKRFVVPAFVNIIVAANAGGAWSPFGDITTLMAWTSGKIQTQEFSYLVIPSIVNWIIPALIMFPFLPKDTPEGSRERVVMKVGAKRIIILGAMTIATAVSFHQFLQLPPFMGMMMGLGLLMFMGFYIKKKYNTGNELLDGSFDIFRKVRRVEFDTLLFFFGVITAVGALQYIGYLALVSEALYGGLGNTKANVIIGLLSAVVDNIPVMFAVLQMDPAMGLDQWLLITLTCGVGGSLLSIGSAAGVAVMGIRRDLYTFMEHLRWAPAIAVGYAVSILAWWVITAGLK
jgi:Na+/H+ antiporter NhaD/arsenite permease-like protein